MVSAKPALVLELQTDVADERPVYIAGNFNNWNGQDDRYRMEKVGAGRYRIEIPAGDRSAHFIYKYTRGSWATVELSEDGNDTPNRQLLPGQRVRRDEVFHWKAAPPKSFAERHPIIEIIDDDFDIPNWVRTRRVTALLPHDYYETTKRYPVLILQDGQNLFDDFAPFGNWALDHKLAELAETNHHEVIIIAIDHAEHERIKEYTPSIETKLGVGEGKEYVRFLVEVLKPAVDRLFRTRTDRSGWGIGGSSMGALVAIYAGLLRTDVFSKMLIFSPSLWVAENIYRVFLPKNLPQRMFMYAGAKESDRLLERIERFKQELRESIAEPELLEYREVIHPEGTHSEYFWGEAFPEALRWLYFPKGS